MPQNSKEFKQLKKEWYKKLKESGFEDVENSIGMLVNWDSRVFFRKQKGSDYMEKIAYYESRQEYYRYAGQFLHDHLFSSDTEKQVWALHSEGVSFRNIVKSLKAQGTPSYKHKVHTIITHLVKIMKERYSIT